MFLFNTDELLHVATCHHLTLFRDRRGTRHKVCTLPSLVAVAGMRRIGNSLSLALSLARSAFAGLRVAKASSASYAARREAENLHHNWARCRHRQRERKRDKAREREWEKGGARAGMYATHTWQLRFTTTN